MTLREELLERVLPFGWFEQSGPESIRFVTDHAGTVPLYYSQEQGRVLAGKTPLEVAEQMVTLTFDPVSVADFLVNGTVCYPFTLFKGVYVAPPGAVTEVTPDEIHSEAYYRPEERETIESVSELGEQLRERVRCALLAGLKDKKKVKVLFSGGEDSRAVVSLLPKDVECELVTFADAYNREVRLAERAASVLDRPLRFVKRPKGFYREKICERTRLIGGISDIRHTHVYGELADPLRGADAVIGGFTSDSLFKSMLLGNVGKSLKWVGPEKLLQTAPNSAVGVAIARDCNWLHAGIALKVDERRKQHHERLAEFRANSAGNWHWLWPLGCQHEQYAHYLATQHLGCTVIEPFLAPQVYRLAAEMPDRFRVDCKVFREAFAKPMGRSGWLQTSSGRIPRLGGYLGYAAALGTRLSRRVMDRAAAAKERKAGREPITQGAWSADHGAFRHGFGELTSGVQFEQTRQLLDTVLSSREAGAFFKDGGGAAPDLVRNRVLQVACLSGVRDE